MNVEKALDQARHERKANKKFFAKLKARPPKDLDEQFHHLHDEVFQRIDCLDCANCCKTTSPIFRDVDIDRLARHLNHYVLNVAPCPFLGPDNYCSVYSARPRACREYPHTDRKNMLQILPLTLRNTLVCPAVGEVVTLCVDEYEYYLSNAHSAFETPRVAHSAARQVRRVGRHQTGSG